MTEEQISLAEIGPSEALIEVRQLPIITERLRQVKEQVEAMTAEASSLVCTMETVQLVKQTRADLRKKFDELENQRKAVKAAVMGPYDAFVRVYEECISGPFRSADNKLKEQIDGFEGELKQRTIERLRAYYNEICSAHGIDWLPFDKAMQKAGIKVSMTDANAKTPKKLMDSLGFFIAGIGAGQDTISKLEDADEIMVEFKKTLNATEAIGIVAERKKALELEKAEAERRAAEAEEIKARIEKAKELAGESIVKAPVIEAPVVEEKIYTIKFTIHTTKAKALKLKSYLIQEGIQYE